MNTPIKFTTAEEAVKVIKSGDHVHLSSVASAPQCLIKAMCARGEAGELKNVHVHHLHTEGPAPYADPKFEGVFQLDSLFVGANVRKVTQSGYADYIPIFLSETQKLYRSGAVPCNVAMIQVCPPDKHGYVSLGTSVDATLAAIECADHVIAVVNKYVPRAFGQAMIPLSKIDLFVQDDQPLVEAKFSEPSDVEKAIGAHCAELIEDGATLQMGIGAIPNAVLAQLGNHKNLGIHTEMFADGVLPLVRKGVINGEAKKTDPGKMVSTFLMGSQEVYNFIDDNPGVTTAEVRNAGFEDYIVEHAPDIKIIHQLSVGTRDTHRATVENMLQAYPEITGMFCFMGDVAIPAYTACKTLGRTDVLIAGYDATPEQVEIMKNDGPDCNLICSNALYPKNIGRVSMETAWQLLEGEVEPGVRIETVNALLTPENADTFEDLLIAQ